MRDVPGAEDLSRKRRAPEKIHEYRVIISGMKNVTITLDEKAAAWARRHAASRNLSLSRFVGQLLEKTMRESREYQRAMRGYLGKTTVRLKRDRDRYPTRDELHDRDGLR